MKRILFLLSCVITISLYAQKLKKYEVQTQTHGGVRIKTYVYANSAHNARKLVQDQNKNKITITIKKVSK